MSFFAYGILLVYFLLQRPASADEQTSGTESAEYKGKTYQQNSR